MAEWDFEPRLPGRCPIPEGLNLLAFQTLSASMMKAVLNWITPPTSLWRLGYANDLLLGQFQQEEDCPYSPALMKLLTAMLFPSKIQKQDQIHIIPFIRTNQTVCSLWSWPELLIWLDVSKIKQKEVGGEQVSQLAIWRTGLTSNLDKMLSRHEDLKWCWC